MTDIRPFYVVSLPRSRTAWLSALLYDPGLVTSFHEILPRADWSGGLRSFQADIHHRAKQSPGAQVAGIIDTGLVSAAPRLPELWPGPVVIVYREPEDVLQSTVRWLGAVEPSVVTALEQSIAQMAADLVIFAARYPSALQVDFRYLDDMFALADIWDHLIGDVAPFPAARAQELLRLRIDVPPDVVLEQTNVASVQHLRALGPCLQFSPSPSPSPNPTRNADLSIS